MVNLACERRTLTPASTRRDRNAEATRQVIMQAGRELFATQPYPEITGLQICVRAGVTRGALQHHFGSKLGLFMAIFDGLQSDGVSRVADALADHDDPWANFPLPTKIIYQVLEPIDIVAQFGEDPDVDDVDAHVRSVMQTALDRLGRQRRFPVLG